MSEPPIVSVTGGSGGIEARYEDLETLARLFDDTGDGLRSAAWDDKAIAANGDLLESAVLSPGSFADAEGAVLGATVGPDGLAVSAVGFEVDAFAIRANVGILRGVDDLQRQLFEGLDYLAGRALGTVLPGLLVLGGAGLLALAATNPALAALVVAHRDELAGMGREELVEFLEDHPEVVQHLINGSGGLLDGLLSTVPPGLRGPLLAGLGLDPLHPTLNGAAGDLAALFGDTGFEVREGGEADAQREFGAPTSLADLIRSLDATNGGMPDATGEVPDVNRPGDGEIDIIRIGEPPDVRYIVNLPGTDDFGVTGDAVRDSRANLELIGGQGTAYAAGIRAAMEDAGIPPGAPVALVGHSQGGMTAAYLASDPGFREDYDVRHVITAGAPTAQIPDLPDDVQVLSLENTGDVVPLTDGEDNPDEPNRTTVRFDGATGDIARNHGLDAYTQGAAAVDASTDPSLTESLEQLREDGFLGNPGPTSTSTYTISRSGG